MRRLSTACTDELANASKWSVCSLEIRSTHTRLFSSLCCALSPFPFSSSSSPKQLIHPLYLCRFSHTHPPFSSLLFFFPYSSVKQQPHPLTHSLILWLIWSVWLVVSPPPPFHTLLQYTLAEVLPQPRAYFTQGLYPSHAGFSKDQTAGTFGSMDLASISMSPGRCAFTPSTHYAWEACSWDFPRQRHQAVIDLLSLVPLGRKMSLVFFVLFSFLLLLTLAENAINHHSYLIARIACYT